ncbi:MAG: iron-sulfur cluster assembly accessory protein [Planctomycetota bacterium]|nr:iron-sulfur cluster assembly accessory protein [Planctomycetota bacterium]
MSTDTTATQAEASATQGGCCGSNPSGCSSSSAAPAQPQAVQQIEMPSQYITDPAAADAPVRLTEKASTEIKRFISEKNVPDGAVLRIVVKAGGCSGFEHTLGFDTRVDEASDLVSEQFGISVVMDGKFAPLMQGTVVDYLDGIDKRGFKFDNPVATGSCGCGSSFSV